MQQLRNIAIIFGGCSPEYPVSLQSAYAVIQHLDRNRFMPILIGITEQGAWYHFRGDVEKVKNNTWFNVNDCCRTAISPCREAHGMLEETPLGLQRIHLDAAFPVLHGKNGEDGTIQGLLEMAGIPIVGCGALASALCMDKNKAHQLVSAAGIRVAKSALLNENSSVEELYTAAEKIGYPLFVKPLRAGSSFGISKVSNAPTLGTAVKRAFMYDQEILLEEAIPGFEVGCAVLGNHWLIVGEVDEIELAKGFFDYHEKYSLETSAIHVPARIPLATAQAVKEAAKLVYRTLSCRGFARVDFFLTPSGEIVFNEVNTIPGFTAHSRYPSMLQATGMRFGQIVDTLIDLALSTDREQQESCLEPQAQVG